MRRNGEVVDFTRYRVKNNSIFTIIPLNSSEFPKIGKFRIIFDAIPREIDDLAVSSRQYFISKFRDFSEFFLEFFRDFSYFKNIYKNAPLIFKVKIL